MTAPSYREIQTKDFSPALGTGQSIFLTETQMVQFVPQAWGQGADHITLGSLVLGQYFGRDAGRKV